ncbi:response regulator [Streptomyces sclerotialus]|uniref:response regulator n=1 Tax=Streptomyces sclerotialus TaxID=1957 RepID=UPI0004C58978
MADRPVRVLLADDHPLVLEGLADRLAVTPDLTVVAGVRTGEEAVRLAQELRPDVAVLDIEMPAPDGIETTRLLRATAPATAVLILTFHDTVQQLETAVQAGALGYLSKHAEPAAILEAVRAVARGAMYLDPRLAEAVRARFRTEYRPPRPFPRLTEREHQVLALLGENCSNEAIALRLGISVKTARNHVSAVLGKLPARDRLEAGRRAREASMRSTPP